MVLPVAGLAGAMILNGSLNIGKQEIGVFEATGITVPSGERVGLGEQVIDVENITTWPGLETRSQEPNGDFLFRDRQLRRLHLAIVLGKHDVGCHQRITDRRPLWILGLQCGEPITGDLQVVARPIVIESNPGSSSLEVRHGQVVSG